MEKLRRVPLLSGSRVILVPVGADDVVIRPPAPPAQVVDVEAAVRDALRFPLSGPSLQAAATPGGRATIVVELPALPVPGGETDPRAAALVSVLRELERAGIARERQTVLVAGGLARRAGAAELARLLPPAQARAFRGRVVVHDAEDERLVAAAGESRIHPTLVESDLVVVLSAAETVVDGGPGALLAACDAATVRAAAGAAPSLLEAGRGPAWGRVLDVEEAVAAQVPLLGVSLLLDLPRLQGTFRGYPHDPAAVSRVARSWSRALFSALPGALRRAVLDSWARSVTATAAFGGRPSVAHAEALVRGVDLRGALLERPVDALVVGVPWIGPHIPREPANPVTAAAIALGLALRLHRDAFPVAHDGTVVLAHPFTRTFGPSEAPYGTMLAALRAAGGPHDVEGLEASADDERAIAGYRAGRHCHPLLPYADWAGCGPALARLGRVVVAGCRDAAAARALGLVPSHGVTSALQMAHGVAGGKARVGVLLAPPYPPLLVGPPG